MKDDLLFKAWLMGKNSLGDKSARDVLSRLKRVSKYVDISSFDSADETIFALDSNRQFRELEMTVKSQLRRAVRLNYLFQESLLKESQQILF